MKNKNRYPLIVTFAVTLLTGCTLGPKQIRARLDACASSQLSNVVYLRADKSVAAIECTPFGDEIDHAEPVHHLPSLLQLPVKPHD